MRRRHVVIIGAGFGGLAAAKGLVGAPVDVTLIDRTNHHLFQPLLYQVATAALTPSDIASATRSLFSKWDNIHVIMDEVVGVDAARSEVRTADSGSIPYDDLIIATGAEYSFFGNDAWSQNAMVLKTMEDALTIRERLLSAYERAEKEPDPVKRSRLLTCVVVGGGPTGVEMAGAVAELGRTSLFADFRRIKFEEIRILLVEAGPRILSAFTERQSQEALKALGELGVDVRLGSSVRGIDEGGVTVGEEFVPAANVVWSAGTMARPAGKWIAADQARNGAVIVKRDCSVPGYPHIFVIGDGAAYQTAEGEWLPGLAPVAKQQGLYVAKLLRARAMGTSEPRPFRYRNWGMMAVIGRSRAVADFGRVKLSGFTAWLAWSLVHLMLLIDFRSRSSVYLSWSYAWFTRDRIARLVTRNANTNFNQKGEN
ncbi:NAD(P)/FAD-dependent oxidoreductase [Brevundimonas diminuta]|uniref:NAD(P)/FAD-dependent oxidoreductase n=1 Tax=Brevundimonas diminuta TaxID=293 RepID=UPI003D9A1DC1